MYFQRLKQWASILGLSAVVAAPTICPSEASAAPQLVSTPKSFKNGRGTNGRGTNGRGTNGRGTNGRGTNGRSALNFHTSLLWGNPNYLQWAFSQPWTQATFDADFGPEGSFAWRALLCSESDRQDIEYLFRIAMAPTDTVRINAGCERYDLPREFDEVVLQGEAGLAANSLREGTFLDDEASKILVTNVMMALTNNAPAVDDPNEVVHNLLRLSGNFDANISDRVEAFNVYRHHVAEVGSVQRACPAGKLMTDADCGYQTHQSRVFRVLADNTTVYFRIATAPALTYRMRLSKGLEAADRNYNSNVPTAPYGMTTTGGNIVSALTSAKVGTTYSATGLKRGVYNITWSTMNPANDIAANDFSSMEIQVADNTGFKASTKLGTTEVDVFAVREATYYSHSGGMFNYDLQAASAKNCYTYAVWDVVFDASGNFLGYSFDVQGTDITTGGSCTHAAAIPTMEMMGGGSRSALFTNVFMATDSFWTTASSSNDLHKYRSCASLQDKTCTGVDAGNANANASWDFTAPSSSDRSYKINELVTAGRVLGEFSKSRFTTRGATSDAGYDSNELGVTTFLSSPTDWMGNTPGALGYSTVLKKTKLAQ